MSFSRVNVGGWSVGATLTSAQMNQLDSDHASALDKSLAGDQLSGVITMASTAAINVNASGAAINVSVADGIQSLAASGIVSSAAQGIMASAAGAIQAGVFGGITPGVAGGIRSNVGQGIQSSTTNGICAMVANGITPNLAGGISDGGVVGGIQTTIASGLKLGGGSSDWPTFTSTRSRNNTSRACSPVALSSGWLFGGSSVPGVVGPATSIRQLIPLNALHQGATMTQLTITFAVGNSHSGVPAVMPSFSVWAVPLSFGALASSILTLSTFDPQVVPTPLSGSAWYSSGTNQFLNYICNQNNVIDTGSYLYVLGIIDENGANSIAGNLYISTTPTYANISNMAFP